MATILIHYFTGTGNTAHAVGIIAKRLQQAGHSVKTVRVINGAVRPLGFYDFHIVAFPVLSWSAPVMMKHYLRRMPRSNGTKAAILAIKGALYTGGKLSAGYSGQALQQVAGILTRKKYDVFLTGEAMFPDNWTQVTNPCSEAEVDAIFPMGEANVHSFLDAFMAQRREQYTCSFFNRSWSWLTALLFGKIGRRVLGKFYIADETCTGCQICVKSCTAGTIRMQHGKPRWNTTCEDCNRCINVCPEKAIQVSVPLFLIQTILNLVLTVGAIWAILAFLPRETWPNRFTLIGSEVLLVLIAVVLMLWVNLVPLDALFMRMARIPAVRRFLSLSYTRKFRRYCAPGFKPLGMQEKM